MVGQTSAADFNQAQIDHWFDSGAYSSLAALAAFAMQAASVERVGPEAIEKIAVACAVSGDADSSRKLFELLIDGSPRQISFRVNLAVLEMQQQHYALAKAQFLQVLEVSPDHPQLRFNLGLALFSLGEYADAAHQLMEAVDRDGNNQVAVLYLARCYVELGEYEAARRLAEAGAWVSILGVRERYELSQLFAALDKTEQAEQVLLDLLVDYPDEAPARINLANLFERTNRIDEAQSQLDQSSDRDSTLYLLAQAKLWAAQRRWLEALAYLDRCCARLADERDTAARKLLSEVEFERGQVLDKLARYDEALHSFGIANALIRDHFRMLHPSVDTDGFKIDWLHDAVELDAVARAARDRASSLTESDPIFLVGFPRSGTTLLDQMLDAHPGLQVMEEKPALEAVVNAVGRLPGGYPGALAALSPREAADLRALYRQQVSRYVDLQPGARLVDKYPFNLSRIHLVMRLFPRAQWIFAIRHPCDVVLSCFMQNFRFTDSTHGFWSIDQTASIYTQIMSLWLSQRSRLSPDCIDIRYEELVDDFEMHARRLIKFLGLPWDDAVLRYDRHARTRRITTPSYKQVVQPIYRNAAGRWRHYRAAFANAEAVLAPLIHTLGYAETPPD